MKPAVNPIKEGGGSQMSTNNLSIRTKLEKYKYIDKNEISRKNEGFLSSLAPNPVKKGGGLQQIVQGIIGLKTSPIVMNIYNE